MANTTSTTVRTAELLAAARALSLAGRWDQALRLLDTADPRRGIALAAAEVAVESDWFRWTDLAEERIAVAEKENPGWDVDFLRLRYDYFRLIHVDDTLRFGPAGKDPQALAEIRHRAAELREHAPDAGRGGWASMYLGLVIDNLFAERTAAPAHYEAALSAAESAGAPLLAREALRHLGDHDHDAGHHDRALTRWRRATELGAAEGAVLGTLSQQMLLAVLARDTGDDSGATALATEIARWAEAVGAVRLHTQATAFLTGTDPTAAPEESQGVTRSTTGERPAAASPPP